MASWAEHAIWWHVYPLGFTGAEKTALVPDEPVRHRLGQLEAWLDYASDPGTPPGDPALVPAHSWIILDS